jgi:hypothetical protein
VDVSPDTAARIFAAIFFFTYAFPVPVGPADGKATG